MKGVGVLSIIGVCVAGGAAFAQSETEECFDKGALVYEECETAPDVELEIEREFDGEAAFSDDEYDPWPGFYIGAHVGYASADSDGFFDDNDPVGEFEFDPIEINGAFFGVHAGWMIRATSDIVVGVEADISYFGVSDETGILDEGPGLDGYQYGEAEIEWFGSVRARAGVPIDRVMPYVTGGVGFVNYNFTLDDEGFGTGGGGEPGRASYNETVLAPVLGGGVEWMITDQLMLRAEGLYYFSEDTIDLDGSIPDADRDNGQEYTIEDLITFRTGLSWRF